MLSQNEIQEIVHQLCQNLDQIFPNQKKDIILFGSYARGEAEYGSDIDLMILIDTDRNQIMSKNREIGEAAGELLLKYGVLVSPNNQALSFTPSFMIFL